MNMTALEQIARQAAEEGRRAEREGRRVIYIHGRPHRDPGDDDQGASVDASGIDRLTDAPENRP